MRTTAVLAAAILGFVPALAAQEARLAGHWEGAMVLAAAEQEADVVMDFSPAQGRLAGRLWFPLTGDGAHAVENLAVQGSHIKFSVRDQDGVVSAFDGSLSSDGASLRGTMRESGQPVPFALHRAKAAPPPRDVRPLQVASSGAQIKKAFNDDIGKVRMLLLLNLGSFSSKMALRVVERYVMDQVSDPALRLYVVWMVPDRPEAVRVLERDVSLAADPRVTHFWSTERSLARIFEPMLAPYQPVSNPCLVFAPDKSWVVTPPVPDRFRQSAKIGARTRVSPGQKLNGIELAGDAMFLLTLKKTR
jgi:hypothetical protein